MNVKPQMWYSLTHNIILAQGNYQLLIFSSFVIKILIAAFFSLLPLQKPILLLLKRTIFSLKVKDLWWTTLFTHYFCNVTLPFMQWISNDFIKEPIFEGFTFTRFVSTFSRYWKGIHNVMTHLEDHFFKERKKESCTLNL